MTHSGMVLDLWTRQRRLPYVIVLALLYTNFWPNLCSAQDLPTVAEGARIRTQLTAAPGHWLTGTVLEVETNYLTMSNDSTKRIAVSDMLALEISRDEVFDVVVKPSHMPGIELKNLVAILLNQAVVVAGENDNTSLLRQFRHSPPRLFLEVRITCPNPLIH